MSFAYNLPCLLPSEEGAPLRLSPPPRFIWVWHPWNTSPPHFETKKLLLHYHLEAPGERPAPPQGSPPDLGSPLGGLAAAAVLFASCDPVLYPRPLPQERPWYPPPVPLSVPQPSIPPAQQPCPSPAPSWARESRLCQRGLGPARLPASGMGPSRLSRHLLCQCCPTPPTGGGVQLPLTG